MENRAIPLFLLFTFLTSCFILQIKAKKQTEALSIIYTVKLRSNTSINRSHFNATHHSHEAKVHPQQGLKEKDRIQSLPGQPSVNFNQYGGYVTVNHTAGTAFYYYFVEAHRSKESLPLLLWLNGGPGCSSLGYGAMQELGPFRVHSDGKTLYENKFAWNHAANVLFLESPAGVGFSYSNTKADFKHGGDRRTANDNYAFLLNWLNRFPEYKNRDFYISGESYAGHYVPQLAHTILFHNRKANKTIINLKGVIIGNAVINDETDMKGMYEYLVSHALVSDETVDKIMKHCDFNAKVIRQTDSCYEATDEVEENIRDVDIYNIYGPLCHNSSLTHKPRKRTSALNLDPCSDDYVQAYLNRPEVQKAMHANITNIPYQWQGCSEVLERWHDSPTTVIPLLKEFMSSGLRVWIFSGDTDGIVPVTGTQHSIKQMNLSVRTSWHPWYLAGEVGGYTQVYEGNLTFATIRGAGHQVPSYQPARALSLIMHFLAGTELPDSRRNL